jgi:hypothetical protein
VQIVQIRRKAEPLNRSVDVLLDVGGRVGDCAEGAALICAEGVEAAFGGNCPQQEGELVKISLTTWFIVAQRGKHTKHLIADIMLPDKVPKELLVDTSLVDYLLSQPLDVEDSLIATE